MLLSSSISRCRSTRASYLFSFHHFVIKIEYNIEMNLFYRFLGSLSVVLKHFLLSGEVNILIDKFRFPVTWMKLKFVIKPPRLLFPFVIWEFPSLRDGSTHLLAVGRFWFILTVYPQYSLAERSSAGRASFSKYWLYDNTHFSPSTPHKLQQTTNVKCSPSSTKFKFTLCQMSILWTFHLLFFGICCRAWTIDETDDRKINR